MTYRKHRTNSNEKMCIHLSQFDTFDFEASVFPSLRPARGQNMWEDNGTIKVLLGF